MKKKKKDTSDLRALRRLKKEASDFKAAGKLKDALEVCEKIADVYPKSSFGHQGIIEIKTNNYEKYLSDEELKDLKKEYEMLIESATKNEKVEIKRKFDEYLDDCREVENLRKIKKEITGKMIIKKIHENSITTINERLVTINTRGVNGKKIKNVYDFLNGLFLIACLIFNLIYHNYLLLLTVPFGIFGIITVYSFIDTNFFKKGSLKEKRQKLKNISKNAKSKIEEIKGLVKETEDSISFLNEQKINTISKIPSLFFEQIKDVMDVNEEEVSSKLVDEALNKKEDTFKEKLELYTNLKTSQLEEMVNKDLELEFNLENKENEKDKTDENKILYMKKVSLGNYVMVFIFLLVSVTSLFTLIFNFYEINLLSFILAFVTAVMSMLIYNINNGRHASFQETVNDNLLSCIFNTTLVYDLVYASITNELNIMYGFVQMPLTFLFLFIGFVMLVSLFKYKYLFRRLNR